jgi:hypothetical protein
MKAAIAILFGSIFGGALLGAAIYLSLRSHRPLEPA